MQPFQPASINSEQITKIVDALTKANLPEERIQKIIDEALDGDVWLNDKYQVIVRRFEIPEFGGSWAHLSIKRIDKEPVHDWRDLQEIKNQLVGAECEGLELYPAQSRVVDTSNQYHIWALTSPGVRFPIGFEEGGTDEDLKAMGIDLPGKQRP
jgi:hypothetical protein